LHALVRTFVRSRSKCPELRRMARGRVQSAQNLLRAAGRQLTARPFGVGDLNGRVETRRLTTRNLGIEPRARRAVRGEGAKVHRRGTLELAPLRVQIAEKSAEP